MMRAIAAIEGSATIFGFINEARSLLMIAIVFLAVVKPF